MALPYGPAGRDFVTYVTMGIAFRLLIAASKITILLTQAIGVGPV